LCAGCGNTDASAVTAPATNSLPEPSIETAETPSDGYFVTVVKKKPMLYGSLVTTAWSALRLRMEETSSS
jgi:hypothetical protein